MQSGMIPEEVERLGRVLQDKSQEIDDTLRQLHQMVGNANWIGPDADRFKNEWWPEHQAKLQQAVHRLHGFGQSALNNASEQRNISS